jgi:hypothetical protein
MLWKIKRRRSDKCPKIGFELENEAERLLGKFGDFFLA